MYNPRVDPEMQWLDYRVARSNAIWFCKQLPMSFISHKWINPITGNYEGALNSCSAQELKKNTEEWIEKTVKEWKKLLTAQHPSALAVAALHVGLDTKTTEKPTGAADVELNGHPECLCPLCMIEEIRVKQNPELKLALDGMERITTAL